MSGIPIGLVRLDVANATIVVLELALNEEVRFLGRRQIEVRARGLRIERDLKILVIELVDRHVCRFELQCGKLLGESLKKSSSLAVSSIGAMRSR